jgi:hypothetical protein
MKLSRRCWIPLLCTGACALAPFFDTGPWLRVWLGALTLATVAWAMIWGKVLAVPAEALLVVWCIPWSMHFLRLMYLDHIWPEYPLFFILAFLVLYLIGFYLPIVGKERQLKNPRPDAVFLDGRGLREWRWIYDICAISGFLCALAAIMSGVTLAGGNFSDLSQVRQAFLTESVSKWDYLVVITSPPGVVAFVVGLLYQEYLGAFRKLVYILAGLCTVVSGAAHAGRYAAVQIVILTLICVAIRRKNHLRPLGDARLTIMMGAILTVLAAYMLILPYFRDNTATSEFAELAASATGVEVDPGLSQTVSAQAPAARDSLYASYIYLAMPLENFRIFYFVYKGSPRFGAFEQGLLARQIARVFPEMPTFEGTLAEREQELEAAGEATTSWQTMVRDAVIDFGWIGCLIFALALGNFGRFVYESALWTCSIPAVTALVGTIFLSVHSIMYSAIGSQDILFLIFWGVVLRMIGGKNSIRRASLIPSAPKPA